MNENINKIQNSFDRTKTMVKDLLAHDEKQLIGAIAIKMCLFVFILFYMGWIYTSFLKVDAGLVVFAGSEKAKETLPDVNRELIKHLNKIAPDVVAQSSEEILKNLPTMEAQVEALIKDTLTEQMDLVEQDLSVWISSHIYESKNRIDKMFPNTKSSYKKVTLMREYIIDDFKKGFAQMNDQVRTP